MLMMRRCLKLGSRTASWKIPPQIKDHVLHKDSAMRSKMVQKPSAAVQHVHTHSHPRPVHGLFRTSHPFTGFDRISKS